MHDRIRVLLEHAHYPNLLPVYGGDYRVHLGNGGPAAHMGTPYTDEAVRPCVIYWWGKDVPYDFLHETGHVLLDTKLTDDQRQDVREIIGGSAEPWFWDRDPMQQSDRPDAYTEVAADAYADLQLHPERRRKLRRYLRQALSAD
jgi:hypothetical protein